MSENSTRPARQCLILSRDTNYTVFLEMVISQYGFRAKVTDMVGNLGALSSSMPTMAWVIDLDNVSETIEDLVKLARQKAPDARLVFLSSQFTVQMAQSCIRLGAIALLLKPFPVQRLVQTLSSIHQERELLEEEDLISSNDQDRDVPVAKTPAGTTPSPMPDHEAEIRDDPLLRIVTLQCSVCRYQFSAARFKLWVMPVCDTDSDFCPVTTGTVHPELYSVMVCPNCCFGYYAGKFGSVKIPEPIRREFLSPKQTAERRALTSGLDFTKKRTLLHGVKAFDIAAHAVQQLRIRNCVKLAGEFYLKASWLCRKMGHGLNERQAQEKALACFEACYRPYLRQGGHFPGRDAVISRLDKMAEPLEERAIVITGFLAGELARRLGDREKALRYLEEAVNIPYLHQYTSLYQHVHAVYRRLKETPG